MNRLRRLVFVGLFAVACDGQEKEAHPHLAEPAGSAGEEHEHGAHEELPRSVTVPEEVVSGAGIRSVALEKERLAETLNLPGEIAADPDRVARISSPAVGRIEAVKFREGEAVKKGAVLAVVRVPEIARIRAEHRAALARSKAARSNATRLRELLAQRLAAEQAVIEAEAEADAAEAESSALAEQLSAVGAGGNGAFLITLKAPIAGTVVARDAVVGQSVGADQALGTIADLEQVWFLGRVFEKDLGKLMVGAPAEVHLNAYPDEHFQGAIEYIGQQVDAAARTVTARIRLQNRGDLLRLGLFGTGQVAAPGGDARPRLVVPSTSVAEIAGKPVVFVETGEGRYDVHEVTLGQEAIGKVEVLAGLREGERVVTEGAFTLKSLVLKGSFSEDEH